MCRVQARVGPSKPAPVAHPAPQQARLVRTYVPGEMVPPVGVGGAPVSSDQAPGTPSWLRPEHAPWASFASLASNAEVPPSALCSGVVPPSAPAACASDVCSDEGAPDAHETGPAVAIMPRENERRAMGDFIDQHLDLRGRVVEIARATRCEVFGDLGMSSLTCRVLGPRSLKQACRVVVKDLSPQARTPLRHDEQLRQRQDRVVERPV